MSTFYELVALGWMGTALALSVLGRPATFAAGLSIAAGTLALVHEHRKHRKLPKPPVYIDVTMDELLEALMQTEEEEPDDARMPVPADSESDEGRPVAVS